MRLPAGPKLISRRPIERAIVRLKTAIGDVAWGMRLSRLLVILLPLLLAACGLTDQQKADYARVQRSGVSSAIYDKMMHGDALSLYDIKALSRAGVSDAIILRYLRDHGTVYYLSSSDVTSLRKAGVSPSIVDYMLQTPQVYASAVYWDYGPYPYPYWYGGPWWGGYPYYHSYYPYRRWH